MSQANTENVNEAIELLKDLEASVDEDLKEVIDFIPNDKHIVGFELVCQYRERENPDDVLTMRIEHGEPVKPFPDGYAYKEKSETDDFPPVRNFQIEPS